VIGNKLAMIWSDLVIDQRPGLPFGLAGQNVHHGLGRDPLEPGLSPGLWREGGRGGLVPAAGVGQVTTVAAWPRWQISGSWRWPAGWSQCPTQVVCQAMAAEGAIAVEGKGGRQSLACLA